MPRETQSPLSAQIWSSNGYSRKFIFLFSQPFASLFRFLTVFPSSHLPRSTLTKKREKKDFFLVTLKCDAKIDGVAFSCVAPFDVSVCVRTRVNSVCWRVRTRIASLFERHKRTQKRPTKMASRVDANVIAKSKRHSVTISLQLQKKT